MWMKSKLELEDSAGRKASKKGEKSNFGGLDMGGHYAECYPG